MSDATIHIPSSAEMYDAALEGLTRINERIIDAGAVPPLYTSGAVYKREPRDTFRHSLDVADQKWGDCEDLAAYRAAELRVSGEDPDAHVYTVRTGPKRFHAIVKRYAGNIPDGARCRFGADCEDPSRMLGMGKYGHGSAGNELVSEAALRGTPHARAKIAAAMNGATMLNQPAACIGDDPAPYRTISFDLMKLGDKWTGVVRIPLGDGTAMFLRPSTSTNKASAAKKSANLSKAALKHPAVQAALPPQARLAAKVLTSAPTAKVAKGILKARKLFG